MKVAQAILALREESENLPDPIPAAMFSAPVPKVVNYLRDPKFEVLQKRSNQEWENLLAKENNPREAALLILDWLADRKQAVEEKAGIEEEKGLPDHERTSR